MSIPESVALFFNGEPMASKAEKYMTEMVADNHTLAFVGPHALPLPVLDKAKFAGAAGNLVASFPDLTFNFTKVEPKQNADGSFSADIVVMGTHTGAPFSPMPGKLPAIDKTDICVKIGPETFTLWVDAEGKVCKTEITPLGAGHPHGPPGFYLGIGGSLTPPPTVFTTPLGDLGAPTKAMGGGEAGPGAKMWLFESQGRKMSRIVIEKGFDWKKSVSPLLPNCPAWCPATHFGYLESGTMGVQMEDGSTRTIRAGESYFIPPGHLPVMDEDAVMVEFSQDETYTNKKFIEGEKAEAPTAPAPVEKLEPFCQPCTGELLQSEPSKTMGEAKMWMQKQQGRQMVRAAMKAGFDWTTTVKPMLPGCPEWCPATHFGYVESGEMGIKMKDGSEHTIKPGQSYYVPPGHLPIIPMDTVFVEFSQDETYTNEKFAAAK